MTMMPPPPNPQPNGMALDQPTGSYEETQSTQQPTQIASQDSEAVIDGHLWGFLIPCSPELRRIDFMRVQPTYRIGRNDNPGMGNHLILPGMKISNQHCIITWDGQDTRNSVVKVTDMSSNGTFINGDKIGKGRFGVLREGNEIAFGTPQPQPQSPEDYRFIYRHMAAGPPTEGLYANYDVTEELGKGSFATVMKAMSKQTGQWYAVKMIQVNHVKAAAAGGEPTGGNRSRPDPAVTLHKEVKILERLKHPNICQLKEVFYESHYINIVLEWVPGGDLLEYILSKGGLSESVSQHITYQLCDALAYIHSQGIAHRDLKPENVLLTTDDPPQVKVADFGLAKAVDNLTMLRTMCGTPSYLAPEVVMQNGVEGYHQVVDSWSVGVIVFSMMTSSSPFIEPSYTTDVKVKILERTIEWAPLHERGISKEAIHFITCLLEENPEQRMSLVDALEHQWLLPCRPALGTAAVAGNEVPMRENTSSPVPAAARDVSMREPLSDSMSMNLDTPSPSLPMHIPGAYPANSQPPTSSPLSQPLSQPGASEARPLQRRRKVLDDAKEKGETPPQPTPEMIAHAERAERAYEADLYGPGQVSRPLKRKADGSVELSDGAIDARRKPLEDAEMAPLDEDAAGPSNVIAQPAGNGYNTRKNKAAAAAVAVPDAPGPLTPGRGKARAAAGGTGRTRGGKNSRTPVVDVPEDDADDDACLSPRLRRSTRLGTQSPRKPS